MTDVAVFLDNGIGAWKAVHDAGVLHVGAVLEDDAAEVSAKTRGRADIAVFADDDVADQHRRRMNKTGRRDDGRNAVDRINTWGSHWLNSLQTATPWAPPGMTMKG